MSSSKYVQAAVANVEKHLHEKCGGHKLAKKAVTPMVYGYCPELDVSPELGPEDANYYQSQIGIL